MRQESDYYQAKREMVVAFITFALSMVSVFQLVTSVSEENICTRIFTLFSTPLAPAGAADVAVIGLSSLIAAVVAQSDLESMRVSWAAGDPVDTKRRMVFLINLQFVSMAFSAIYFIAAYPLLGFAPIGLAAVVGAGIQLMQLPYYGLLVERFIRQQKISFEIPDAPQDTHTERDA